MKHLNTTSQLRLGLVILTTLTLILGFIAWYQANILWEQTRNIYEHPLKVRRALSEVRVSTLKVQIKLNDLLLTNDSAVSEQIKDEIEANNWIINNNIDSIRKYFLGSPIVVDTIQFNFNKLDDSRKETMRLIQNGKSEEAITRIKQNGAERIAYRAFNSHLDHINTFSWDKAVEFYKKAETQKNMMTVQLLLVILVIGLVILLTGYIMIRNIRKPLHELTRAADDFTKGNFASRSSYVGRNEFGKLSRSFNSLASTIQSEITERAKTQHLTEHLITSDSLDDLSTTILHEIIRESGAQAGLFLTFIHEKGLFECKASVGLDKELLHRNWRCDEGEFGLSCKSRKIERIRTIPDNTFATFHTSYGNFQPREILTIPITAESEVVAMISLASTSFFDERIFQSLQNILPLLNARFNALYAVQNVRNMANRLNVKNQELQMQQDELTRQAQEMKTQNLELEMQKQQLFEASRLKTTFLSNMSHELRTPLNSVIALSGVLGRRLGGKIPSDEFGYLEVIERNGKHLLSLINDILDLSRIESGKEEVELTEFDLVQVVAETCMMIRPQAQQKNILLVEPEGGEPVRIVSDSRKCKQILQNLVGNAVKFTQEGSISIGIRNMGESFQVIVTDTGIGISATQIEHIFEEFRQADETTSRKYGGSGLGLAIARKYARFLGGDIGVTSSPGKGSAFTWTIPANPQINKQDHIIKSELAIARKEPGHASSIKNEADYTILLVDDSEPAIIQLTDILTEQGFRVLTANSGAEAIKLLEYNLPHAIVLDLMMPEIDGFQVLKTIRDNERTAGLPVLVLTAKHITREDLKTLKQNHIHQLIQKGDVNRIELIRAIRNMIHHESEEPAETTVYTPPAGNRFTILAVEDNPDNMLTLKALLTENYNLIEAYNGLEGVEKALEHKPHIILMDIALPEMNGIEALHHIRKIPGIGNVPIIAVTASAMSGDRDAIMSEGFDGYVSKPLDGHILENMIHHFLYNK